jgi:hypothetical protein
VVRGVLPAEQLALLDDEFFGALRVLRAAGNGGPGSVLHGPGISTILPQLVKKYSKKENVKQNEEKQNEEGNANKQNEDRQNEEGNEQNVHDGQQNAEKNAEEERNEQNADSGDNQEIAQNNQIVSNAVNLLQRGSQNRQNRQQDRQRSANNQPNLARRCSDLAARWQDSLESKCSDIQNSVNAGVQSVNQSVNSRVPSRIKSACLAVRKKLETAFIYTCVLPPVWVLNKGMNLTNDIRHNSWLFKHYLTKKFRDARGLTTDRMGDIKDENWKRRKAERKERRRRAREEGLGRGMRSSRGVSPESSEKGENEEVKNEEVENEGVENEEVENEEGNEEENSDLDADIADQIQEWRDSMRSAVSPTDNFDRLRSGVQAVCSRLSAGVIEAGDALSTRPKLLVALMGLSYMSALAAIFVMVENQVLGR